MNTPNIRTIIVKYIHASLKKPARIQLTDLRRKQTKFISYHDSEHDRSEDVAKEYLEKRGIKIDSQSEGSGYMMLHTSNFQTAIK